MGQSTVLHGIWIEMPMRYTEIVASGEAVKKAIRLLKCSVCGEPTLFCATLHFCKNCGAKMDLSFTREEDTNVPANCGNCGNYDREKGEFAEACGVCKVMHGGVGAPSEYKAKPMTNADRIRAMSDEELVDLIFKYDIDDCILFCEERPECATAIEDDSFDPNGPQCRECLLKWLRQPAEVDDYG